MSTGNRLGDEGAKMISEGMKSNSILTELNLGGEEQKKEEEMQAKNGKKVKVQIMTLVRK